VSEHIVTDAVMSGLETAAKAATPGPHHIYTHFRDDNNHKANQWFFENCYPQYVLELIQRVRSSEAELAGFRATVKAECLRLTSGDVAVFTLAERHLKFGGQWNHYREGLRQTLPAGVSALILAEGVSVSVLTDDQLARAGLMRRTEQDWSDTDAAALPEPLLNAFITSESGGADGYCIKLKFNTLEDLQKGHRHLLAAVPVETYRELQAQYDQLQTQLFNERQKSQALAAEVDACNDRNGELEDARQSLDKLLSARINRTGDIEATLLEMATGKLALPTQQDCRVLALRLGTPKKDWTDIVKNHQFGQPADKDQK